MSLPTELKTRLRILMPLVKRGITGVLHLGRYNYTAAQPGLADHAHRGAIEICFLVKGRQTYCLGGRSHHLSGGDVFIAFPDERHSTGGLPQEKGVLYWMILEAPSLGRSFLGLPVKQGEALLQDLLNVKPRHFRGSWRMQEHLDTITALYRQAASPVNAFAITNHVGAFLLEVIACARARPARVKGSPLTAVLRHIEDHPDEPLSVPALAERAGLSVARFKARFKEETGVPPGEYVLRVRIGEAQRRLSQGKFTVTDVAYDLGFPTSQYFATVFKRFTGVTPSAWVSAGWS